MNELQVQHVVGGGYPGMKFETPAVAKLLTKYAVQRKMLEQVWEDFHGLMRFFRKMALQRPPLLHTPKEWENLADMQAWILREWMELPNRKDQWVLIRPKPPRFLPKENPFQGWATCKDKGEYVNVPPPMYYDSYPKFRSGMGMCQARTVMYQWAELPPQYGTLGGTWGDDIACLNTGYDSETRHLRANWAC